MGMKPRGTKKKEPEQAQPGQMNQRFDAVQVGGTTVKVVLERPAGVPAVKSMKITGGKLKRVGSAVQQKTPGGPKLMTLNILYTDDT
jgi:hypothetical protein